MDKEELYYKAPINIMRRKDLSFAEIGLLLYLRSCDEGNKATETSVCRQFSCDSRTLKKLLQSLHNKGFINELSNLKGYKEGIMSKEELYTTEDFTVIPNSLLRAGINLSIQQRYILIYLLSYIAGDKKSITSISREMQTDIRVIKNILAKLCDKGYSEIVLSVVKNYNLEG